jgi:aspartyl-tRNA synthetase
MGCCLDEEQVVLHHRLQESQVLELAQPVPLELLEQQVDEEVRMKARLIQLRYPADFACSHRAAR